MHRLVVLVRHHDIDDELGADLERGNGRRGLGDGLVCFLGKANGRRE